MLAIIGAMKNCHRLWGVCPYHEQKRLVRLCGSLDTTARGVWVLDLSSSWEQHGPCRRLELQPDARVSSEIFYVRLMQTRWNCWSQRLCNIRWSDESLSLDIFQHLKLKHQCAKNNGSLVLVKKSREFWEVAIPVFFQNEKDEKPRVGCTR